MDYRENIINRTEEKKTDYVKYNFSPSENDAFKTFFDLAQEFDNIHDFYTLCVMIPKIFFGLDCRLYTIELKQQAMVLVAQSDDEGRDLNIPPPAYITPSDRAYRSDSGSIVLTIRGKEFLKDQIALPLSGDILGFLEVYPSNGFDSHKEFFFEKYANRIGFNLHNRLLVIRNVEHLKFIRSLVADIEHNVIVPNMVYKLYLRRLRGEVIKNSDLEQFLSRSIGMDNLDRKDLEIMLKDMHDVNEGLSAELDNLEKHYKNISLFIESLFRKSHFDQGRLTLRTKSCNIKRDVLEAQLEQYSERFKDAGISIDDRISAIPDEDVISVVDIGLIAQVFANLFSNALKYAGEVEILGEKKKYMAYGHEVLKDFFGAGKDGVKYNVFSSGPHIPLNERRKIFEEEYRAKRARDIPGTGHGLSFVKNVVELHGGVVGYEPTDYGNNFYFILPQ